MAVGTGRSRDWLGAGEIRLAHRKSGGAEKTLSPAQPVRALTGETKLKRNQFAPMNAQPSTSISRSLRAATMSILSICALAAVPARAADASALVDDFSDPKLTSNGAQRLLIDDKAMGCQSHATQKCEGGVIVVQGELAPGRGLPAFISLPLLLSSDAKPQDLSDYKGVRIRVKVTKGILTVQVGSSAIDNFDYHTSGPLAPKRGEFQELRVPFKEMKRGWSEQTALDLKTITSVNLVAFGMAKDAFNYEVDEIGFY